MPRYLALCRAMSRYVVLCRTTPLLSELQHVVLRRVMPRYVAVVWTMLCYAALGCTARHRVMLH
jgi:hypothetical protein